MSEPLASATPFAVPRATYRLQFSRAFTFRDAERLVPYLDALGVSHVYASPYVKARAAKPLSLVPRRRRRWKPSKGCAVRGPDRSPVGPGGTPTLRIASLANPTARVAGTHDDRNGTRRSPASLDTQSPRK
jgi:hypothetical protein